MVASMNLKSVDLKSVALKSIDYESALTTSVLTKPVAPVAPVAQFDLSKAKETLKQNAYEVVVVKFGGNAIGNESVLDALIDEAVVLIKAGIHVIVVHGGGTAVNDALAAIGKETKKIDGLRVTDEETLAVAVKVFTDINNKLTEKFRQRGVSALSFCSKSAIPFQTEKMSDDLGWVGEIVDVRDSGIASWMWAGWTAIVSPIGIDSSGQFYNINADHAALALATSLEADGLIFMTDVPGVLKDFNLPQTRIGHVTATSAQELIEDGTVTGGMLPKIKSCVKAIKNGIRRIAIVNSFAPNALVRGFLAPQETGTLITGDKYKYDH